MSHTIATFADLPCYSPERPSGYFTGVGSRETPSDYLEKLGQIGAYLSRKGLVCRTGDAIGPDRVFRDVCGHQCEVYSANDANDLVRAIAREIHPVGNNLKGKALDLHARNTFQVFGLSLTAPSDFVVCYTRDGYIGEPGTRTRRSGGTAQAIEMAALKGIPVVNLARPDWRETLRRVLVAS